ncbi:hypothetical protein H0H93_003988, partial [Arthromyces matolae]
MSVSHVCSHWRDVALTTPHIWANIRVDRPKWAQEMLKRSKKVPLIIKHQRNLNESQYNTLLEILRQELARISILKLTLNDDQNTQITPLLTSLDEPAPLLEYLEVTASSPSENAQLPGGIIVPRLRQLILHGCGLPTPPPSFANLRSLDISGIAGITQPPSMLVLLDLLSQTPLLELFRVMDVASLSISGSTSKATTRPHIVLRHLGDISITCDISDAALFFDTVTFSQTASSIRFTQRRGASESESTNSSILMMSRLGRKLGDNIKYYPLTALSIHDNGELSWWIEGNGDPIVDMNLVVHNSATLGLLMIAACRSLRLDQLSSLFVSVPLDVDEWLRFGHLPCLQLLYVHGNERSFLEAFSRGIQAKPDESIAPSFTALTKLEVVLWDFKRVHGDRRISVAKQAID